MKFEKTEDSRYKLDVTGYVCPHPQIYTKKALSKIQSGDHLEVVFDNPSSGESIATMCENNGDEIISQNKDGGSFVWDILKQ